MAKPTKTETTPPPGTPAPAEAPNKGGRPLTYEPRFAVIAAKMCELGATDFDLATAFEVASSTVRRWRHEHEEFAKACTSGKDMANTHVERSLYAKATGYTYSSEKIVVVEGKIERVEITEHVPPSDTACIFWLKNRRPDIWRDRDVSDAPTKPCDVSANPLTPEEWAAKYGSGSRRAN